MKCQAKLASFVSPLLPLWPWHAFASSLRRLSVPEGQAHVSRHRTTTALPPSRRCCHGLGAGQSTSIIMLHQVEASVTSAFLWLQLPLRGGCRWIGHSISLSRPNVQAH